MKHFLRALEIREQSTMISERQTVDRVRTVLAPDQGTWKGILESLTVPWNGQDRAGVWDSQYN